MPPNRSFKISNPPLFEKIIELAETKTLGPSAIGKHPEVLALNNGKEILYGTIQRIVTDEKGKKFFKEIAKNKSFFIGDIRKGALENLNNILEDYYKGTGIKKLTKKYFPNSPDAKKGTASTVLEDVIKENADPERLKNRPDITGTTAKGVSPAKIILNNPEAKAEFIKFGNTKGNTILDSMKEAGVIAKKYAPVGTKVAGYTSRAGFMGSGLRELITQKVQLGKQDVDPAVTSRLNKIQNIIAKTKLPDTKLQIDSPVVKTMANKVKMTPAQFLGGVTKLKEIYKTGRQGFTVNPKVESVISRFPDARFNRSLFLSKGYSKKTVRTLDAVEEAAKKLTKTQGTQLEHSMPKALIEEFKLPRSNYLKGERTSNFLNQFKKQFDNQIINAAKDFRDGKISYDEYKKIVVNIVRKVAARTGGYKMGYIDFTDGDPTKAYAVTEQKSILKGDKPRGRRQTGLKNFLKNSVYHNELYRQFTADPNNSDFGTLRDEIKQSKFKFVPEPELENLHNATKNLKTTEEIFEFYKKDTPLSKLFRLGLTKASGFRGGRGAKLLKGIATPALFGLALSAGTTREKGITPEELIARQNAMINFNEIKEPEVKQPEVGTPIKYDPNVGAIVNENTDQPASQNQILSYIKDNPLKVTAGTSLAFAAEEIPGAYKTARGVGETGPLPKGRGRVRSALGISGALKPVLTTIGTPAMTALFEAPFAAKRLEEGETATEILTDPLGPALGVAFMEPFSRGAGVIRGAPKRTMAQGLRNYFNLSNVGQARPGVTSKVLRLGMSPRMIAGASRFLGIPGLLLGAGLSGYDAYKNYQNQEGFLYNLINRDE